VGGGHVSLFFETKEDLFEIVVPYLKAGLESNEFCLWVIAEPISQKEAMAVAASGYSGPSSISRRAAARGAVGA
jgi:hypothetical protein